MVVDPAPLHTRPGHMSKVSETTVPLHWIIDSRSQVVTIIGTGVLQVMDFDSLLAAIVGAGALGYAKLFDGTAPDLAMDADDMLRVGVLCRSLHTRPIGALAVVLPADKQEQASRLLGILAAAERPMRLFSKTTRGAQRWLASVGRPTEGESRGGSRYDSNTNALSSGTGPQVPKAAPCMVVSRPAGAARRPIQQRGTRRRKG